MISQPLKNPNLKQGQYKNSYLLKKVLDISGKWAGDRLGQKQEKWEDRMSNGTRQNNKRVDKKMESNDSPEIREREETSEELGLASGQNNIIV